jgi:cyclopropane fatty-acyl-phospholipid synthase-like methyltransferase
VNRTSGSTDPKRVVQQGYDQVAYDYARLEGESEWPRTRWLRKLLNKLEPCSSVLDLGCGSGKPADVEISKEHQVTGVDISQTQINLARQNVPTGHFLHIDAGSAEFPPSSFDAVVSFYTLEHIPREEHKTVLQNIYKWLRVGGLLLISMEAGDYDDVMGEWLGVPMFISCYDPDTMKQMVNEAGFELLETAIETQLEGVNDIPFLWVLGQKR